MPVPMEHGVPYPAEFAEIEPRELARLSQTNVTRSAWLGLQYAAAAYDAGLRPDVAAADPTLAVEAAAKAGFRAEQANQSTTVVREWFSRSYEAINNDTSSMRREQIATSLLEGRAWGLRLLKNTVQTPDAKAISAGRTAFLSGEHLLQDQHQGSHTWDPYGTMLSRHRATFEAVHGSAPLAARVATQGLWRAIRARQETANAPAGIIKHAQFVGKQILMNTAALSLAVSKPFNFIPPLKNFRRRFAAKLLG